MGELERLGCREGTATELRVREANAGEASAVVAAWCDHMDDVNEVDPAKLQIEEGMVAEVMKRLEEEINRPCDSGGDGEAVPWFHEPRCWLCPSASSSAAAAFVTVSGNEESCGASFSDSASTVMASIDTSGVPRRPVGAAGAADDVGEFWPWFLEPAAEETAAALWDAGGAATGAVGGDGGGGATEGFAVEDTEGSDEEWLARVLSGSGFEPGAHR